MLLLPFLLHFKISSGSTDSRNDWDSVIRRTQIKAGSMISRPYVQLGLAMLLLSACDDTQFTGGSKTRRTPVSNEAVPQQPPEPSGDVASAPEVFEEEVLKGEVNEDSPKFGLLVNDLRCGLCHVKVSGDVVSTRDVDAVWS